MARKPDNTGPEISILWGKAGLVSITASPEDWNSIRLDVEAAGEKCVLEAGKLPDGWIFSKGKDGLITATHAADECEHVVGVEKELKDAETVGHPTPRRKPR